MNNMNELQQLQQNNNHKIKYHKYQNFIYHK